ncbi:hypothetical protein MEC_00006 [Bartonella alsatica IBS 382]|uniref:Uncharacterized protein n=1 Tax=Bartonella alsatica IBS 382 TaxID=1094551 RepID=J0YNH5_9HYPH|nr:hypothetical protein MEC_00006 [Bartonella alsatica IBS 382]
MEENVERMVNAFREMCLKEDKLRGKVVGREEEIRQV